MGCCSISISRGRTHLSLIPQSTAHERTKPLPCSIQSQHPTLPSAFHNRPTPQRQGDAPCVYAGFLFAEQGIKSCAVNTSAPVGTTFAVTLLVFDDSIPSLNASVTRTVSIIQPCSIGEHLCSDGACSAIACDLRFVLSLYDTLYCCVTRQTGVVQRPSVVCLSLHKRSFLW